MTNISMINPYPFIYHFRDPQGVCFSIIKGEKLSIVVDCGYGIINVREIVESYIDTPYIVVCTHGHMDHSSGYFQFDNVYIPENDIELFKLHNNVEKRTKNIEGAKDLNIIDNTFDRETYINQEIKNITLLKNNHIFDLGNMHVEVIPMEGHTKGSIGLLIKEHKLLFTGDAAISMIWMFLKESTSKETYIKMLQRVKELDFTHFITGHLMTVFEKKFFDYYLEVATTATPENSERVTFKNFERPNTFQYAKKFGEYNIGICYQEPKED